MEACRSAVDQLRARVTSGELTGPALDAAIDGLADEIAGSVRADSSGTYPAVVNATGVLLHTNLGRAPLRQDLPPS